MRLLGLLSAFQSFALLLNTYVFLRKEFLSIHPKRIVEIPYHVNQEVVEIDYVLRKYIPLVVLCKVLNVLHFLLIYLAGFVAESMCSHSLYYLLEHLHNKVLFRLRQKKDTNLLHLFHRKRLPSHVFTPLRKISLVKIVNKKESILKTRQLSSYVKKNCLHFFMI